MGRGSSPRALAPLCLGAKAKPGLPLCLLKSTDPSAQPRRGLGCRKGEGLCQPKPTRTQRVTDRILDFSREDAPFIVGSSPLFHAIKS